MRYFMIPLTMVVAVAAACSDRWSFPTNPVEVQLSVTAAAYDCTTGQTQIDPLECQALVALYNATGGPNWTNEKASYKRWLVGSPCDWYGIDCGGGTFHGLGLSGNNLIGSIPPELGNLRGLSYLDLYENKLSGSIPPELGDLSNLDFLTLARNQLSGPIPSELGSLSKLKLLGLYENQLSGAIPPQLGNLSKLEGLGLFSNRLSGAIPPQLGNLSELTELALWHNQLSGPIPSALGNLTKLSGLGLGGNQLSGPIPASFGNLTRLVNLELTDNELSGPIPASLGNLEDLAELWLFLNQLSGPIPPELGNLSSLTHLVLHDNQLSGLVPIGVAALELPAPPDGYCSFVRNQGLYMPDREPYSAYVDDDGLICGLALISDFAPVAIDIKPGSDPNSVNCHASDEVISVAILTTDDFDAMTVDHTTVTFEGASETHVNDKTGEPRRHEEDVDEDGDIDLVLHFRLGDTSLTCEATVGTLIGETWDGDFIADTDAVRMVG